jgi:hypothetical protein
MWHFTVNDQRTFYGTDCPATGELRRLEPGYGRPLEIRRPQNGAPFAKAGKISVGTSRQDEGPTGAMTVTLVPDESAIETALGAFLNGIGLFCTLPQSTVEVVAGQDNRVSEPQSHDFVVVTPIRRSRLLTNIDSYNYGSGTKSAQQNTQITYQCDVHGPNSSDNAQLISTLFRDDYGYNVISGSNAAVTPLHADEPRQVPYINAEAQFETRWIVDCVLQADQVVSELPQQFFDSATVTAISVEAALAE